MKYFLLLLIVVSLIFSSCFSTNNIGSDPECDSNNPCDSGFICVDGFCEVDNNQNNEFGGVGFNPNYSPPVLGSGNTYYVSNFGNDNNDGSINSPWKTISKVNSKISDLQPGDNILFKKGDVFRGPLFINELKGTANQKITFSTYGEGSKPTFTLVEEISGWNNPNNWEQINTLAEPEKNGHVWHMDYPGFEVPRRITRMWFDGDESPVAAYLDKGSLVPEDSSYTDHRGKYSGDNLDGTFGLSQKHRFYYNMGRGVLYVYTDDKSNPADFYDELNYSGIMTMDGYLERYTVKIDKSEYIVFDGINFEGGLHGPVWMINSDYMTFKNCEIGKFSGWIGISGTSGSDFVTIDNCIVDSGFQEDQRLQYSKSSGVQYGVSPYIGAEHWEIKNSLLRYWAFPIFVHGPADGPSKNHLIHHNEFTSPGVSWGKTMQLNSYTNPLDQNVHFYNNYVHDIPSGIQVSPSSKNYFYFNIFDNIYGPVNEHSTTLSGSFAFSFIKSEGPTSPENNVIIGNTFHRVGGFVDGYAGRGTVRLNNLYLDNGWLWYEYNGNSFATRPSSWDGNDIWKNNLFYSPRLDESGEMIYIQDDKGHTLEYFNNLDTQNHVGNFQHVGNINEIMNTNDFSLVQGSPAINAGVDISEYILEGFRDMNGNLVDVRNPDLGAIVYE